MWKKHKMRSYFFCYARKELDLATGFKKPGSKAEISKTDSNAENIQLIRENLIVTISNTTMVRYCQESPALNPHATDRRSTMVCSMYGLSVCRTCRQPCNAQCSNLQQQINSPGGGVQQDVLKAVLCSKLSLTALLPSAPSAVPLVSYTPRPLSGSIMVIFQLRNTQS